MNWRWQFSDLRKKYAAENTKGRCLGLEALRKFYLLIFLLIFAQNWSLILSKNAENLGFYLNAMARGPNDLQIKKIKILCDLYTSNFHLEQEVHQFFTFAQSETL